MTSIASLLWLLSVCKGRSEFHGSPEGQQALETFPRNPSVAKTEKLYLFPFSDNRGAGDGISMEPPRLRARTAETQTVYAGQSPRNHWLETSAKRFPNERPSDSWAFLEYAAAHQNSAHRLNRTEQTKIFDSNRNSRGYVHANVQRLDYFRNVLESDQFFSKQSAGATDLSQAFNLLIPLALVRRSKSGAQRKSL